jgi:hypothetical protein
MLASFGLGLTLGCAGDDGSIAAATDEGGVGTATNADDGDANDDASTSSGPDETTSSRGTTSSDASDSGGSSDTGASTDTGPTADTGTTGDAILFADDFDRPDTTAGLGNDWIVNVQGGRPPSTLHIAAGQALPFFGAVFTMPLFHASPSAFRPELFPQARIRVSADLVTVGGSYDGLVALFARSQVSSNEILDTYWCGFLAAAKKLYLAKVTDGVLETIAISGPDILPLPQDSTSRLSLTIDGDELTCEISGAVDHTLSGTDTTFESGYIGMIGGKPEQNTVRFDDFVIETL